MGLHPWTSLLAEQLRLMAKIKACNNSDLSIHLDSVKSFLPGQRITGYVSRTSPWVGTETSISITFHGRCNTEFFCHDSSLCRSSLEQFGQDGVRNELFNGDLHIQTSCTDENKWLFAIDIPRHPHPSFLRSHPFGKASYLPLLYADQHALPPSFDLGSSAAVSRCGFAVVEYYLEAIMMTPSSSKPVIARMPVQLRCESSPFPITDFDIKLHSRQLHTIASPCLIPATETAKISMGQKIAKVLGFSRAPRLTFCLEISIASVLQRGSPYHIPFEMRAIPQLVDTSGCIANVPQIIAINKFALAVRSTTSIIAFATGAAAPVTVVREDHFVTKIILADYMKPKKGNQINNQGLQSEAQSEACPLGEHSSSYGSPLTLPIGDNTTPLDIGQMLELKLQHEKFRAHEVSTFITHNIKRTYELEWKMSLEVGGEILRVKGRHPALIMEKTEQDWEG